MEQARGDVVCRLFVAATEILEDNHIVAVGGQSQQMSMAHYRDAAEQLRGAAAQLATLAGAVIVLLDLEAQQPPDR